MIFTIVLFNKLKIDMNVLKKYTFMKGYFLKHQYILMTQNYMLSNNYWHLIYEILVILK